MLKKLFKLSALLLIPLMLTASGVMASGKMEVQLGEKIALRADNAPSGASYKWVVKKGQDILGTQTTSTFNYVFPEQGEYEVNLVTTDSSGQSKSTTVYVLAGNRYQRPSFTTEDGKTVTTTPDGKTIITQDGQTIFEDEEGPLSVSFSTLPPAEDDGSIHLAGDGRVLFTIDTFRTDVIEYRIDRNIFADSDGNGTANDDIDNASDDSYLVGGSWYADYKMGEAAKIVPEITLVTRDGKKAKAQIDIVFEEPPVRTGDPVAALSVTPAPSPNDNIIYLYEDSSEVSFYSRGSTGKILEYRIDSNIFADTNGDGNPSNDVDNLNDLSFKTGDVWTTKYAKTDGQIIAQLIVVGEGGKGSRIQREIKFIDGPKPRLGASASATATGIQLAADKDFVLTGDLVTFTVQGLKQSMDNYSFKWDFDGDMEYDKETEGENIITHAYDSPDLYKVRATVTDKQGNAGDFYLEMLVKDAASTSADFDFKVDGNTVRFTNMSVASMNLADKALEYKWSFGDTDPEGYDEQKGQLAMENPVYTYNKAGTYIVVLTVTDADLVTASKKAEVVIEKSLKTETEEEVTETAAGDEETAAPAEAETGGGEGGSLVVKILKVILYIILIIIVLILLIFTGFMVFLKVQNPDLTFEELIDEIKIKILKMLGVEDMIEHPADAMTNDKFPISKDGEPIIPPSGARIDETPIEAPVADDEVVEGEVVDNDQFPISNDKLNSKSENTKNSGSDDRQSDEDDSDDDSAGGGDSGGGAAGDDDGKDETVHPPGDDSLNKQNGPVPDWLQGV